MTVCTSTRFLDAVAGKKEQPLMYSSACGWFNCLVITTWKPRFQQKPHSAKNAKRFLVRMLHKIYHPCFQQIVSLLLRQKTAYSNLSWTLFLRLGRRQVVYKLISFKCFENVCRLPSAKQTETRPSRNRSELHLPHRSRRLRPLDTGRIQWFAAFLSAQMSRS